MTDTSVAPITVVSQPQPPDTVSLIVNGQSISGFTDVRISRRCEGIPNDFEIGLTSSDPLTSVATVANAGQSCAVKIGSSTVITGYIDRNTNAGDAQSHTLTIVGRGSCCDLVDCSAEWPGGQISGADALQVASKLGEPYDITVNAGPGYTAGPAIPQFNLNFGETAQELIDRVCTYSGLLYYEDEFGDLLIGPVGSVSAASGFAYGQNVQTYSVVNAMDQRYSAYNCVLTSVDIFQDLGDSSLVFFSAMDPNVARHRILYLVAESVSGSQALAQKRALWEAARRAGRGTAVSLTCDSWRDSGGTLWTPNTLAPVSLPGLANGAVTTLCISEVVFRYNTSSGKTADITLLPASAFQPQPIQIQPTPFATGELTS